MDINEIFDSNDPDTAEIRNLWAQFGIGDHSPSPVNDIVETLRILAEDEYNNHQEATTLLFEGKTFMGTDGIFCPVMLSSAYTSDAVFASIVDIFAPYFLDTMHLVHTIMDFIFTTHGITRGLCINILIDMNAQVRICHSFPEYVSEIQRIFPELNLQEPIMDLLNNSNEKDDSRYICAPVHDIHRYRKIIPAAILKMYVSSLIEFSDDIIISEEYLFDILDVSQYTMDTVVSLATVNKDALYYFTEHINAIENILRISDLNTLKEHDIIDDSLVIDTIMSYGDATSGRTLASFNDAIRNMREFYM